MSQLVITRFTKIASDHPVCKSSFIISKALGFQSWHDRKSQADMVVLVASHTSPLSLFHCHSQYVQCDWCCHEMFCLYTGVLISLLATGYASEWIPVEGIVDADFEEEVDWGKWYCSGCDGSKSNDAVSGSFSMLSVNRYVTINGALMAINRVQPRGVRYLLL